MPRTVSPGLNRLVLALLVVIIIVGFTPISRSLLSSVHGSFAPASYSSLALKNPSNAAVGIQSGHSVSVALTNHTGHSKTYHWSATQDGALISLGEDTVGNGEQTTILVPSRGAVAGTLRIALTNTNVFLTVPILKS